METTNTYNKNFNLKRFFVFRVIFFFLLSMNLYAMNEIEEGDLRAYIKSTAGTTIIKELGKNIDGRVLVGSFCKKWNCWNKNVFYPNWGFHSQNSNFNSCQPNKNDSFSGAVWACQERVDIYIPDTKGVETAIENMDKSLKTAVTNGLSKDPITTLTSKIEALEERIKELEKNKDSTDNTP